MKIPGWGFASSPLVVDDVVIVAAAGKLAAYDPATGKPRWFGPNGGDGYSSPQLFTIDGVAQVLLMSGHGATSVAPADGTVLWEYPWPSDTRIVQPAAEPDRFYANLLQDAYSDGERRNRRSSGALEASRYGRGEDKCRERRRCRSLHRPHGGRR
jgi:outer membrane protein assembly factor BamB